MTAQEDVILIAIGYTETVKNRRSYQFFFWTNYLKLNFGINL